MSTKKHSKADVKSRRGWGAAPDRVYVGIANVGTGREELIAKRHVRNTLVRSKVIGLSAYRARNDWQLGADVTIQAFRKRVAGDPRDLSYKVRSRVYVLCDRDGAIVDVFGVRLNACVEVERRRAFGFKADKIVTYVRISDVGKVAA